MVIFFRLVIFEFRNQHEVTFLSTPLLSPNAIFEFLFGFVYIWSL